MLKLLLVFADLVERKDAVRVSKVCMWMSKMPHPAVKAWYYPFVMCHLLLWVFWSSLSLLTLSSWPCHAAVQGFWSPLAFKRNKLFSKQCWSTVPCCPHLIYLSFILFSKRWFFRCLPGITAVLKSPFPDLQGDCPGTFLVPLFGTQWSIFARDSFQPNGRKGKFMSVFAVW